MNDTITIPRAEFDRLVDAAEELDAIRAIEDYHANPQDGLPHRYMVRLIDGEAPLAVFRDWRGLSQSDLARRAGVNRTQLADIEAGRKTGSVATLRKLADALDVALDDLV